MLNEDFRLGAVNTHVCMQSARDRNCWINIKWFIIQNCCMQLWVLTAPNRLILIQQYQSLADCMQSWVLTAPNLNFSLILIENCRRSWFMGFLVFCREKERGERRERRITSLYWLKFEIALLYILEPQYNNLRCTICHTISRLCNFESLTSYLFSLFDLVIFLREFLLKFTLIWYHLLMWHSSNITFL
jgi:hypothetical protein